MLHFGEVRLVVVLRDVFQKVFAALLILAHWARWILNRVNVSVVVNNGLVVILKRRHLKFLVFGTGVITVGFNSKLKKQLLYFLLVFKLLGQRRFLCH
jgi:hypothetical protein